MSLVLTVVYAEAIAAFHLGKPDLRLSVDRSYLPLPHLYGVEVEPLIIEGDVAGGVGARF